MSALASLSELVVSRARPEASSWFRDELDGCGDANRAGRAFVAAARKLGREPIGVAADLGVMVVVGTTPIDEVARFALLIAACERLGDAGPTLVETLYRTGDLREKQAVVRALALLPDAQRFVSIAAHAVRADAMAVFEALACENPYPSLHLPDESWNQMIVKALFNNLRLGRVVGLAGRRNPELARMAKALESERRAAGRTIPEDLHLVVSKEPTP